LSGAAVAGVRPRGLGRHAPGEWRTAGPAPGTGMHGVHVGRAFGRRGARGGQASGRRDTQPVTNLVQAAPEMAGIDRDPRTLGGHEGCWSMTPANRCRARCRHADEVGG
jgi:hypothetical protein